MKILTTICLFFFLISLSTAQHAGKHYADDLQILTTSLQELYPMLYKSISKTQFDSNVTVTYNRLLQAGNKFEAAYITQDFLYRLGDAHAYVESIYGNLGIEKILPFKVLLLEDSIYIKSFPAHPEFIGAKILAIDSLDSGRILDSIRMLISDDGSRTTGFALQPLFNSFYGAFISQRDTFHLRTDKGMLIAPAVKKNDTLYKDLIRNSWTDYLITDHHGVTKYVTPEYGYFGFDNFLRKIKGHRVEKEFRLLLRELKKKNVPNLVIDLRYNSGGNPNMGGRMAARLADKPFKVYERVLYTRPERPTYMKHLRKPYVLLIRRFGVRKREGQYQRVRFDRNLKTTHPKKSRYTGNIYVITGPMTLSASTMFCTYLLGQKNVFFVGSETPGAINYFCAHHACELMLPSSGMKVTFGLELIELIKGSSDKEQPRGLIPEHRVKYSVQDLLEKKDKEMEWIRGKVGH